MSSQKKNKLKNRGKQRQKSVSAAKENIQLDQLPEKAQEADTNRRGVLTRLRALLNALRYGTEQAGNEEENQIIRAGVLDYSKRRILDLNFEMGMNKYHEEFWRKYCG